MGNASFKQYSWTPYPSFSDNSYALNVNFQVISLTNTGYIHLLTEQTSHCCERTTLWAVPLNSFLNSGPADWTQDRASTLWRSHTPATQEHFCCFSSWGISLALNLRPALFAAFCTFFARLLVLFRLGWHLLTLPCWADIVSSIGLLKSILPGAPGSCPLPSLPCELRQPPAWDHLWTCRHITLTPQVLTLVTFPGEGRRNWFWYRTGEVEGGGS